jgi:endonuclease G
MERIIVADDHMPQNDERRWLMNLPRVPDRIAQAARARVEEAEARVQRRRVAAATATGDLLTAEPDAQRTIRRFQAVAGVDLQQAEALAQGEDPARLGLAGEARLGAEAIQGKTVDFLGISFLDQARAASSCVGRVIYRSGEPLGTGFLISDHLFMTNNHVIGTAEEAAHLLLEFNYELDNRGRARAVTRFSFDPAAFFLTSDSDALDYTVIAVGGRETGVGDLADFGFCPLFDSDDKHKLGEFVNIIQHPSGNYKQIVLRENQIVTRLDTVLHYETDTLEGSSGSPVFNDQWEAVALHHWGGPHREDRDADGRPVRRDVNEGIRISAIVRSLQEASGALTTSARTWLDAALSVSFRQPSRAGLVASVATPPTPHGPANPTGIEDAQGACVSRHAPHIEHEASATQQEMQMSEPPSARLNPDGSVTLIVPLEVTVRMPGQGRAGTATPTSPMSAHGPEAVRPDPNYTNRRGYDPEFLPGFSLPMPTVTDRAPGSPARLRHPAPGADPHELKYEHFSIIMNRDRKMACVTAANIDGQHSRSVDRRSGRVRDGGVRGVSNGRGDREAPEASETWYGDERLDDEAQTDQRLYSNQRPSHVFDRGHQVRREDPVWGDDREAERANADTFHFTNCCPQESRFNQQQRFWQGIENYVLENARDEDARVSVFTGPVFAATDPEYRDSLVPLQFFKVIARVERGQLKTTALLASQAELLSGLPERLSGPPGAERFSDTGRVREYLTTVKHVETLTGLDFGRLRDHDTSDGDESLGRPATLLKTWADLHLG